MKRLVFCFDGTWNKLNVSTSTNVVLTAASIIRHTKSGITQLVHYDEGVGTTIYTRLIGGIFGFGLLENVRKAYRFLIFNYDPGDEIFVFGFSRGAFSARSFIGLLRCVGPLRRLHAGRIDEAIDLYKQRLTDSDKTSDKLRRFRAEYSDAVCIDPEEEAWRSKNMTNYINGSCPLMKIKYLGVWDTVGALGVPDIFPRSSRINKRLKFHDVSIDDFIDHARHAVALDEMRKLFPPELYGDNICALNNKRGYDPSDNMSPYQERWFPGVHGSVGGGGDIRGLSDGALHWILKGAQKAGLELDTEKGTRIDGFAPNPLAPLSNIKDQGPQRRSILKKYRAGPSQIWQLSQSTIFRWQNTRSEDNVLQYAPDSLKRVLTDLTSLPSSKFIALPELLATETVKFGDNLSKYAQKHYGKASLWTIIFEANKDTITEPDDIFPGQTIRIPFHIDEPTSPTYD